MRNIFFSLAIVTLASSPAFGSWAAVPLEILIDEADLIVAGKVSKIQDGGFTIGPRPYDVAVVEVKNVLKTLSGKPMQVQIGQPAAGGIGLSTDIRFKAGQQGIWLLTKDPDRNVYWARHPSQFQEAKQEKVLTELVVDRKKLPGGKPVNGLVARAELLEHRSEKAPISYEIRFSLKNVSDKPIIVCDHPGKGPLDVEWTGPDGTRMKSNHYAWLARAFLPPLMKNHFATIPPGGVKFIGPRGAYSGILFQTQPSPQTNEAQAGRHKVAVSYTSEVDGKPFGLKEVWSGTVKSNAVSFLVK